MAGRAVIRIGDGDPRHGTFNGYQNLKCRCADCRRANTDHFWNKRHPDRPRPVKTVARIDLRPRAAHGSRSMFQLGCRCEPCVQAQRTYNRQWAAKNGDRYPHGTATRYSTGGCRCDDCTDAVREYKLIASPVSLDDSNWGRGVTTWVGGKHLVEWSDPTGEQAIQRVANSDDVDPELWKDEIAS